MGHCAQVCLGFLVLVSQQSPKASPWPLPIPRSGKHGFRQGPNIYNLNNYFIPGKAFLLAGQEDLVCLRGSPHKSIWAKNPLRWCLGKSIPSWVLYLFTSSSYALFKSPHFYVSRFLFYPKGIYRLRAFY